MIATYLGTCILGYAAFGSDVAGFLPDSMAPGFAKSIVGVLLTLHTAVAYMVTAQPLHRAIHAAIFPETLTSRAGSRVVGHWLLISTGQLVISILLAVAVPFFADLQALLGSLTGAPMIFGFPALFFLRARRLQGLSVSVRDQLLCYFFIFVLTPLFLILGTCTSVKSIVRSWQAVP